MDRRWRWAKPAVGLIMGLLVAAGLDPALARAAAPTRSDPATTAIDPKLGVSTAPVRPIFTTTRSVFEGQPVLESIPVHVKGIVYLFHGSGGGVGFVDGLETVDVLNTLVAQGYGFVATQSTNRATKQWNVTDVSEVTNPDLARLGRLRAHVVATTPVTPATPTYGMGMSNGAAFAALWAAVSQRSGASVDAVALYMSAPRAVVFRSGGLDVPTFMVIGQNDTRTSPTRERAALARIAAGGSPTELEEVPQRALVAARYLRVPGVDSTMAASIVDAYRVAGIVDDRGNLELTLPKIGPGGTDPLAGRVRLPHSLTGIQARDVGDETLAAIGEHQFNAEFKVQNAAFFDRHRGSPPAS